MDLSTKECFKKEDRDLYSSAEFSDIFFFEGGWVWKFKKKSFWPCLKQ